MINKFCRKYFSSAHQALLNDVLSKQLQDIQKAGTYKKERVISSPQEMEIISDGKKVLNFCANNYLGLSNNK